MKLSLQFDADDKEGTIVGEIKGNDESANVISALLIFLHTQGWKPIRTDITPKEPRPKSEIAKAAR